MLPAVDAIQYPSLCAQQLDGMDDMSYDPRDEMKDLDESLVTFELRTLIQRCDSTQPCPEQTLERTE
jgi:hypothetical protein